MSKRAEFQAAALVVLVAVTGCSEHSKKSGPGPGYHVTIRETSYGIPHVLADDTGSASAGLGYVAARDYGCIMLDQLVRLRGERSRYFGPGSGDRNVQSDFGMRALGIVERGKRSIDVMPSDLRKGLEGAG